MPVKKNNIYIQRITRKPAEDMKSTIKNTIRVT